MLRGSVSSDGNEYCVWQRNASPMSPTMMPFRHAWAVTGVLPCQRPSSQVQWGREGGRDLGGESGG